MSESLLRNFTLDENISYDIRCYTKNVFKKKEVNLFDEMADIMFVETYGKVIEQAGKFGAQCALNEFLGDKSVDLSDPELMKFYIHGSFAGNIPVICTESIEDFEKLVCKIVYKGIYSGQVKNMGAAFMHNKAGAFVILSNKPYSNVPASELGLDDGIWKEYSIIIRCEHECLHHFTKKFYGSTRNHLHDELIADFVGIVSATGTYNAGWFLRCLGIDSKAKHEAAKVRFDIYTEGVSPEAAEVLRRITTLASHSVERYYKSRHNGNLSETVDFLCSRDLLELTEI